MADLEQQAQQPQDEDPNESWGGGHFRILHLLNPFINWQSCRLDLTS